MHVRPSRTDFLAAWIKGAKAERTAQTRDTMPAPMLGQFVTDLNFPGRAVVPAYRVSFGFSTGRCKQANLI